MSTLQVLALRSPKGEGETGEEDEEEEEEEEPADGQEPDAAEPGEEEETSFVSERQASYIIRQVAESYSYLYLVPALVARLKDSRYGRIPIEVVEWSANVPRQLWGRLRRTIRKLSDIVNLSFLALSRLMERSNAANVVVRVLGTIVAGAVLIFLTIVVPIWRLVNTPWRFVARLLGELGINIPTDEE